MTSPFRLCRCGHSMADMDGTDPRCCVQGCDQRGCREDADSRPDVPPQGGWYPGLVGRDTNGLPKPADSRTGTVVDMHLPDEDVTL